MAAGNVGQVSLFVCAVVEAVKKKTMDGRMCKIIMVHSFDNFILLLCSYWL